MTTVTTAPQVKVNVMTLEQYKSTTKQDTEFYLIKDANPEVIDNLVERVGDLEEGKANVDLSNLSSTGESHFANPSLSNLSAAGQAVIDSKQDIATAVNYNNITNCITEIPQDIKLELNNGTLTLKAGSKVYVPNGFEEDGTTPKFDIRIIENNVSNTASFNTQHSMMYQQSLGSFAHFVQGYNLFSGSTDPTGVPTPSTNYNTTLNKMRFSDDGGSSWIDVDYSLPFAITTSNSSQYTSIDQVFNGFGYIGSTVFALPGVKGLIPNGRNEDGSLKNIECVTNSVLTVAFANGVLYLSGELGIFDGFVGPTEHFYNEQKNIIDFLGTKVFWCECIDIVNSNFTPKTAFHAVDYSDFVDVIDSKIQLVNELPANPEQGVLYCIPEA